MRNIVALLANLQDPERLIGHPYARLVLEDAASRLEEPADAAAGVRALRLAAFSALDRLRDEPTAFRMYSVISRCDVQGWSHKAVAHELGLSRRQFYRDLHRARHYVESAIFAQTWERQSNSGSSSSTIARQPLIRGRAPSGQRAVSTDPFRLELVYIRSLEQIGELEAASNRLRTLANEIDDSVRRSQVLSTLSGALLEQGLAGVAREHCDRALREADASGNQIAICEAETASAKIAVSAGDSSVADAMLRRSISRLRGLRGLGEPTLRANALAKALIVRAEAEILVGHFGASQASALEAEGQLQDADHTDPLLRLSARLAAAAAGGLAWVSPVAAESEMRACYDAATEGGFIVKAIEAGIMLSTIHRLKGKVEPAIELLQSILPVANRMSNGRVRLSFFISLANALAASGKAQEALDALAIASRSFLPDQRIERACFSLAMARAYLGVGRAEDAIREAEQAEDRMEQLGLIGFFGASLHVHANGLAALGRRSEALRLSRRSVDALTGGGHPEALRAARATLGRLRMSDVSAG